MDIYLHNHPKIIVFTFKNNLKLQILYLDILIFKININYHDFGKRTRETLLKMIKSKSNTFFLERTDERSN